MTHVVITGAGSGIGEATARRLAKRGFSMSLFGRNIDSLKRVAEDTNSKFFKVDVTNEEEVKEGLKEAVSANGEISILINNAGAAESAPLSKTDRKLWDRMLGVNLTGVYLCTRESLIYLTQDGLILNISSTAGLTGYKYVTAYCAAKHGVIGFSKALSEEFKGTKRRVNVICPGYTDTALFRDSIKKTSEKTGRSEEEIKKEFLKNAKLITPDDVAKVVENFCDEKVLNGEVKVVGDF